MNRIIIDGEETNQDGQPTAFQVMVSGSLGKTNTTNDSSTSASDDNDESEEEDEVDHSEEKAKLQQGQDFSATSIMKQQQYNNNLSATTIPFNGDLSSNPVATGDAQSLDRQLADESNLYSQFRFAGSASSGVNSNHYEQESAANARVLHQQQQPQKPVEQRSCAGNQKHSHDDVKHVDLFGVRIVALTINGKERLCLAQISNTLLKEFSYNEIHNRRVALGITCVQCTPVQLEMLRRAGAMPSSSRRCGMITMREAERLCRSFLVEEQPPELPENFYFTVAHRVNYGCKGRFVPARYISSRAKCIECFYCGEFYSPNKFIFHSHKQPNVTDCNPPDSPNINSWRKHIDLDWTQEHSQEIKYAWEDVKSLFNGGTRRRAPTNGPIIANEERLSPDDSNATTCRQKKSTKLNATDELDDDQEIDVEYHDATTRNNNCNKSRISEKLQNLGDRSVANELKNQQQQNSNHKQFASKNTTDERTGNNEITGNLKLEHLLPIKRSLHTSQSNKRFSSSQRACLEGVTNQDERTQTNLSYYHQAPSDLRPICSAPTRQRNFPPQSLIAAQVAATSGQSLLIGEHLSTSGSANHGNQIQPSTEGSISDGQKVSTLGGIDYFTDATPPSSNFIYNQLYSQLVQSQSRQQQQQTGKLSRISEMDAAQLALRQHLWTNLLANLQRNAAAAAAFQSTSSIQAQQAYNDVRAHTGLPQATTGMTIGNHCGPQMRPMSDTEINPNTTNFTSNLSLISAAQMYSPQAAATAAAVALNNDNGNCK